MATKKNAIANSFLYFFKYLVPLATFPYLTRILSKEKLGNVFFIDSIVQYLLIFTAAGVPLYAIREISKLGKQMEQKTRFAADLIIIQFTLSIGAVAVLLLSPYIFPSLWQNIWLIRIGCISIICSSFMVEWYFQAIENYRYITYRTVLIKTIAAICILFIVKKQDDDIKYYLLVNLFILLNAIVNFYFFCRNSSKISLKGTRIIPHLKPLFIFFLLNLSVSIYTILDTVILGFLTNSVSVSLYNVPLKIVKIASGFILSIGFVLIPTMSRYHKLKQTEKIETMVSQMLNITLLFAIPFCLFFLVLSKEIISITAGTSYSEAHNILMVLAPLPLIISICNALGTQFLLPSGEEKKILHATGIGLIISILSNIILIKTYNYLGSAIACLLTETFVCIFIYYHAQKRIKLRIDKKLLGNIVIAVVTTTVGYFVTRQYLNGVMLIGVNGILYLATFICSHFLIFKSDYLNGIINIKQVK